MTIQTKNCFLIRNPKEVILSYLKIYEDITPELIGFSQQVYIFNYIMKKTNRIPIVISSEDILQNPKLILQKLCNLLDIPFSKQMLSWPVGTRDSDGIWGKYWYKNVVETSSFSKSSEKNDELPKQFSSLLDECNTYYKQIKKYKVTND